MCVLLKHPTSGSSRITVLLGLLLKLFLSSFYARRKKADEYNARLAEGRMKPPLSLRLGLMSRLRGDGEERLKRWREKDGKAEPSLICMGHEWRHQAVVLVRWCSEGHSDTARNESSHTEGRDGLYGL